MKQVPIVLFCKGIINLAGLCLLGFTAPVLCAQVTSTTLSNGLIVEAPGDSPWLRLMHPGWKGHVNLLLPELIGDRYKRRVYMDTSGQGVAWERTQEGLAAHYRLEQVGGYDLVIAGVDDGLLMDLTILNASDENWEYCALTACMQNHWLPNFFDPTEERSFIRVQGAWVPVNQAVDKIGSNWLLPPGKVPCEIMNPSLRQGTYHLGTVAPDEAIAAVRSKDGDWVLAQAWHEARYINVNTGLDRGRDYACTDVSPFLGTIGAGQTLHLRGKTYLFPGSLGDLERRYKSDCAHGVIFCNEPIL